MCGSDQRGEHGNTCGPLVAESGPFLLSTMKLQRTSLQPVKTRVAGGCSGSHSREVKQRCAAVRIPTLQLVGTGASDPKPRSQSDAEDSRPFWVVVKIK